MSWDVCEHVVMHCVNKYVCFYGIPAHSVGPLRSVHSCELCHSVGAQLIRCTSLCVFRSGGVFLDGSYKQVCVERVFHQIRCEVCFL